MNNATNNVTLCRGPWEYASIREQHTPLRCPHHSCSVRAIVGTVRTTGSHGIEYTPGEISLAQNGVLMLTNLPEFNGEVIAEIGIVLRDGAVTLYIGPRSLKIHLAHFRVVATAAACPCGMLSRPRVRCSCTATARAVFEDRIARFMDLLEGPASR